MRIGLVRGECSKLRQNLSDDVADHVLQRLRLAIGIGDPEYHKRASHIVVYLLRSQYS